MSDSKHLERSAKSLRRLLGSFFKKTFRAEGENSKGPALDRSKKRFQVLIDRFFGKFLSRRSFLKGAGAVAGAAVLASPKKAPALTFAEFFQKHYQELTPADKERIFQRIEKKTKEKYGVDVTVTDPLPIPGVAFAYFLSLTKCNGNRRCVEACVKENNQSRDPAIQYITVLEMEAGSFDLNESNRYYNPPEVPEKGKFYLPVQCQQCANPPCVKACPVEATWKEADGIVVIDYNWCIGCRYCQAACPYEARRFNYSEPVLAADQINPNQAYLSNRIREKGVVEKCTFCLQRTRKGRYPACLEACPTGARKFGNLLDPNSEVSQILKNKMTYILKEELNTQPRFFYYFD